MTVSASALKIAVTDLSNIVSVFQGVTLTNKENIDVSDKIAAVWQYDSVGNQYLPIDATLFKTTRFNTATSVDFFIVALAGTINIADILFTTLINADTAPDALQCTPGSLSTQGQPNTWSASSGAVDVSINTDQSGAAVFDTVFARTRVPVSVYTPGLQGMPVMNYANGSFYNVAKAIFIDGYNSKAVSTIAGNTNDETAVISLDSGHGFAVDQVVEIVGLQFANAQYWNETSLLLLGDFYGTDDSIIDEKGHQIGVQGDVKLTSEQFKNGTSSIKFDGSGDYLMTPAAGICDFGTGDFTTEMWIRPTTDSQAVLIDNRPVGVQGNQFTIALNYGAPGRIGLYTNGAWKLTSTGTISLNTWTHIAFSRVSGVTKLFINGVLDNSDADTVSYVVANTMYIGGNSYAIGESIFNGYIDDFRITKGVGRYTADFTPPGDLATNTNTNCATGSTFRVIESNATSIKVRVPKRFFMNYAGGASVTVKGASLGWNLEFDYPANYRMVISTSGNDDLPKQYLYIDDKVTTYLGFVYLIGYDMVTAMPATGMPTGTGQSPYDTYGQYSRKNYNTLTQSWHFIGDEHFFYWFNDHISSATTAYQWGRVMFFGHLVADHPELKKHTACIKQNYNGTTSPQTMNATSVYSDYFPYSSASTSMYDKFVPIRTIQGAAIEVVKPNLMARHVCGGRPGCSGNMINYYAQYQPVSGQLMYGDRVDILDQASAQYRGSMPGMKIPLYSFNYTDYCGDIVMIDGVRHLKMCSSDSAAAANKMFYFIAIDGGWR